MRTEIEAPLWEVRTFASLGSTSTHAISLCNGAVRPPHGVVIRAGSQSDGRGRLGRIWTSSTGNFFQSLIVTPNIHLPDGFALAFVTALAIADVIDDYAADELVGLKWPNDVLIDGKKIAGVLIESGTIIGNSAAWYVVGTGVNLQSAPYGAATLREYDLEIDPVTFGDLFLSAFAIRYVDWLSAGFEPIRRQWLAKAAFLGQDIFVGVPEDRKYGRFVSIGLDGALELETTEGLLRLTTGDVQLIGSEWEVFHVTGD